MVRQGRCALVAVLCFFSMSAWAQVTIPEEYDKLIRHRGEVTAFGNDGFGDWVDIGSGGLEIVQTDIDLPGKSALPVRLTRRFVPGNRFSLGHFGVWNLDVPNMHGVFANHPGNPIGWTVPGSGGDIYKRCSHYSAPPALFFQTGEFLPDEYWQGSFFRLPGGGDEELLNSGANAHIPNDGDAYPIVTKSGAVVRCAPLAVTSENGSQGEGFEVVAPDGVIYTLNHMVSREVSLITKPIGALAIKGSTRQGGVIKPMAAPNFILPRKEVILYPTRVMDRFGGYVNYIWNAANPWQLQRIEASDGRQIIFTYDGDSRQVKSASDGSRVWSYAGDSSAYTVTRPDGGVWVSNLEGIYNFEIHATGDGCYGEPIYSGSSSSAMGTIVSPTGAVATFTMAPIKMGRSWVYRSCVFSESGEPIYAAEPISYFSLALIEKRVSGPALPALGLSWIYSYGPANGCWGDEGAPLCTVSSSTTRTVSVSDPEGHLTRYTFGNRFAKNEGLLLKVEHGLSGGGVSRVTDFAYADPYSSPYGVYSGSSPRERGDGFTSSRKRPRVSEVSSQQGRVFSWRVASSCAGMPYCFDVYARPARIERSVSP